MVGSTRDRAAAAHDVEKVRPLSMSRGVSVRAGGRSDHGGEPGGGHHGSEGDHRRGRGKDASTRATLPWSDWGRGKLGITLAAGVILACLLGGAYLLWRVPARAVATASVVVVWHLPGQETAQISTVDRDQWQNFIALWQLERIKARHAILDQTRAEMIAAVHPLFDDMKARIKDYTDWFYFFPTTYRMAFTGVIAALSRGANDQRTVEQAATEAINRSLQDRFLEVVVMPERFGPAVEDRAKEALQHAIASELAVAETENRALAAFMAGHGRPADGNGGAAVDQPLPVVLSWEALGLPATAASMAAPPDAAQLVKQDAALGDLQSSAGAEGTMLVARQVARRVVQVAVNTATTATVLPMLSGGVLGPAEVVVSPLLGIAAFGIGIGAEFGTVKFRQAVEGPQLTEVSESVVERLRESETRVLADAVVKRVDTWLGG